MKAISVKNRMILLAILFPVAIGISCGGRGGNRGSSTMVPPTVFSSYDLTGTFEPVRDPSVIRQNNMYYAFSTDTGAPISGNLPILCSVDRVTWVWCGAIFTPDSAVDSARGSRDPRFVSARHFLFQRALPYLLRRFHIRFQHIRHRPGNQHDARQL